MNTDISTTESTPVIYITGFGPFGKHKQNASAKVLGKLAASDLESQLGVKLVTEVLDVAYEPVLERVTATWKTIRPKLAIHIGVSELAQNIVLEKQAFNEEYSKPDVFNCFTHSKQCVPGSPRVIQTQLDLDKAIADLEKEGEAPLKCSLSHDPGRYLCGFVYYLSLSINRHRSLFVHVPTLRSQHTDPDIAATRMASTVCALVKNLYRQVTDVEEEKELCHC